MNWAPKLKYSVFLSSRIFSNQLPSIMYGLSLLNHVTIYIYGRLLNYRGIGRHKVTRHETLQKREASSILYICII